MSVHPSHQSSMGSPDMHTDVPRTLRSIDVRHGSFKKAAAASSHAHVSDLLLMDASYESRRPNLCICDTEHSRPLDGSEDHMESSGERTRSPSKKFVLQSPSKPFTRRGKRPPPLQYVKSFADVDAKTSGNESRLHAKSGNNRDKVLTAFDVRRRTSSVSQTGSTATDSSKYWASVDSDGRSDASTITRHTSFSAEFLPSSGDLHSQLRQVRKATEEARRSHNNKKAHGADRLSAQRRGGDNTEYRSAPIKKSEPAKKTSAGPLTSWPIRIKSDGGRPQSQRNSPVSASPESGTRRRFSLSARNRSTSCSPSRRFSLSKKLPKVKGFLSNIFSKLRM